MALLSVALVGCAAAATPQIVPSATAPIIPSPTSTIPDTPTPMIALAPESDSTIAPVNPSPESSLAAIPPSETSVAASAESTPESFESTVAPPPASAMALVNSFLDLTLRFDSAGVQAMGDSGDPAYIPVLVDYMRFMPPQNVRGREFILDALMDLSDANPDELEGSPRFWDWWARWVGKHSEVRGPASYDTFKGLMLARLVDQEMAVFFYDGVNSRIRLEEIVWGGVPKDGIPDLTNPRVLSPEQADYLIIDDRVFGVSFNGEHRAYPLRVLNAHEMANDVVGGVPFALAY